MQKKRNGLKTRADLIPLSVMALIFLALAGSHLNGIWKKNRPNPGIKPSAGCWLDAKDEIDRSIEDIMEQNRLESEKGIRFRKIIKGKESLPYIALTFDDGPHPGSTRQILKILETEKIKATFFLVGKKVLQYPQLVRLQVEQGHSIGNHTFNHINLKTASAGMAATEIKACGKAIKLIAGKAPSLFRPPGGNYNNEVISIADALGYTTVLWTANAGDCAGISTDNIRDRIISRTGNGGIILMHDGIKESNNMLPELIKGFKRRGYRFVTVDELISIKTRIAARPLPATQFLMENGVYGRAGAMLNNAGGAVFRMILMPFGSQARR